jgi:hypothetical protein
MSEQEQTTSAKTEQNGSRTGAKKEQKQKQEHDKEQEQSSRRRAEAEAGTEQGAGT